MPYSHLRIMVNIMQTLVHTQTATHFILMARATVEAMTIKRFSPFTTFEHGFAVVQTVLMEFINSSPDMKWMDKWVGLSKMSISISFPPEYLEILENLNEICWKESWKHVIIEKMGQFEPDFDGMERLMPHLVVS
jgi:hypothetical protein